MAVRQPRYSKEEFARRGDEIYESQVRQQAEEGNQGKIVAIDIETGAFEIADDLLTASKQLSARVSDAQTWFVRIGHPAVDRFGARSLRPKQ
ncbi:MULTISPECIES: hypothetical protein [unclassified Roseofilum]|uniref:hypothetical protein n=1 Tax=unclassified Roseofilum TaxID=2620099 RepID=UPI000E9DC245|nr:MULTISPECIES: hypothetical protein [unclassified Roseofilum]MBP0006902.1 hypothetical protein [Roseofilum sp. Belize Diploria]MBP0031995.1 hypothetical protein [Roseofilum sp. Belize BBD 4]MBP0043350.1 hypothetical protein [Roseofilum sp. SBFL]HBR00765.1 hypothetical protein [Cyanobacteria bacterium UBA11691]